jgi:hypothetical protein
MLDPAPWLTLRGKATVNAKLAQVVNPKSALTPSVGVGAGIMMVDDGTPKTVERTQELKRPGLGISPKSTK